MITNRLALGAFLAAVACAPPKENAASDSLPQIDTLKPAAETLPSADAAGQMKGGTTAAGAKTSGTMTSGPKASGATSKAKSTIIGRDSVTPFDPTRKRLDTVRKKP